jgi:hypothetical protein
MNQLGMILSFRALSVDWKRFYDAGMAFQGACQGEIPRRGRGELAAGMSADIPRGARGHPAMSVDIFFRAAKP